MTGPATHPRRLRRRDARVRHARHFGPNMTPMVDVVLVLLIFFMAGASFLVKEWQTPAIVRPERASALDATRAELPSAQIAVAVGASGPSGSSGSSATASIDAFGAFGMDREAFAAAVTSAAADFAQGDVTLVIRPRSEAPYELVVWVHDRCLGAGFTRIELEASR